MTALELEHVPEDRDSATDNWRNNIPVTLERVLPSSIRVSLHPQISPDSTQTRTQQSPSNFKDYIATLPEITQRLMLSYEFVPGGERTLRECLANNSKLRAASDGSLDPDAELASFGWQLLGNGNVLIRGAGPVDGAPDLLSSTRAELFGISAVLEFLYQFCVFANLSESTSKVILWVDNKAAITKVNRTRKKGAKRRRLCHDADIICQITDRLDRLPMKIRLEWVKSHQDRKTPYSDLDMAGRMNVDADSLAESFRSSMTEEPFLPIRQGLENPLTAVTLLIDGVRISSHYSHSIRSSIQKKKHRSYLQEKHEWSDTVWHALDLDALKSAFLTLDPIKRISCSKRIHGWLNTGAQKAHISPEAPEAHKCPRCHLVPETPEHVLQCNHSSAHKRRYELLPPMQRRMLTVPGCRVQQLFFDCLRSWLANPDNISPDISHIPIEQRGLVETALSEQKAIGWDMCSRGYLSRHWALAVSANPRLSKHDKNLPLHRSETGKTWARKVVSQL
jgi:ribonuclease HI